MMRDELRPILQEWLAHEMSEISEEGMSAAWLTDLEFEIWEMCQEPMDREWYNTTVTADQLRKIRAVAEELGEWCVWDGEAPSMRRFISLDDWRQRYDEAVVMRELWLKSWQ